MLVCAPLLSHGHELIGGNVLHRFQLCFYEGKNIKITCYTMQNYISLKEITFDKVLRTGHVFAIRSNTPALFFRQRTF